MSRPRAGTRAADLRKLLLRGARSRQEDFQVTLSRYGVERLLYRLSTSRHAESFILKGAMLFQLWGDQPHRPTRDLDLLGRGENSIPRFERIFQEVCDLAVEEDGLVFNAQSVRGETQIPEYVSTNLERIFSTARELTRALDEIVWAVNPRHDTLESLANYLSRFAYDFLTVAEIRCRLDLPLQLPAVLVTTEVRHNLFLAFKEALNNVVKHAAASEVQVALKLEANQLTLTVADNGRDFVVNDPAPKPPTNPDRIMHGHGLPNMKRRLAEIGGACEVQGVAGQGTTVTLLFPAAS